MPVPKPFDPFGDFEQSGYLQNFLGLSDPEEVKTVEHSTFLANLPDAIEALRLGEAITYQSFLDTHRILFGDFYPWAGRDRSEVAAELQISKGSDVVFANAPDIRRAINYGLRLAEAPGLRQVPGAVMGYFAHGHPFLDGNGRTLMLVFGELCFRHGFSIALERTCKSDYLKALTEELATPGKGILDRYLTLFLAEPIAHDLYTKALEELPGLDGLDRFLDDDIKAVDYRSDENAASVYAEAMKGRYEAYKSNDESSGCGIICRRLFPSIHFDMSPLHWKHSSGDRACIESYWLYRQLEAEYDHLTSDEVIEDGTIVNGYTFTEAGRRFG